MQRNLAFAVSHGSTGKGNDQVRFELGYYYFAPKMKVIAPWRIWTMNSRSDLIKYAKKNKIPIPKDKKGATAFSVDDNLFHTSTEGKALENPKTLPQSLYIKEQYLQRKLQIVKFCDHQF